jgi:hypothetical protein
MKGKFFKIAKDLGAVIATYDTYRSDMGFQVYEIMYSFPDVPRSFNFIDSYPPPEAGGQDKILKQFKHEVENNKQ